MKILGFFLGLIRVHKVHRKSGRCASAVKRGSEGTYIHPFEPGEGTLNPKP